ncbi:MAG: hypothetical protein Q4D60_11735 [Eubacteriales bacterium]|nr:hypothetical protein [Eubacteriales bacterium]
MEEFYKDLIYFIDQDRVDVHYRDKKIEVSNWLIEYTGNLKRLKEEQRKILMAYAKAINILQIGKLNLYVQSLTTVSKKDKERLSKYLRQIDWLPEDQNMGVLDGIMFSRVLSNPLAEMLQEEPPRPTKKKTTRRN